jgi:hypothetical protein
MQGYAGEFVCLLLRYCKPPALTQLTRSWRELGQPPLTSLAPLGSPKAGMLLHAAHNVYERAQQLMPSFACPEEVDLHHEAWLWEQALYCASLPAAGARPRHPPFTMDELVRAKCGKDEKERNLDDERVFSSAVNLAEKRVRVIEVLRSRARAEAEAAAGGGPAGSAGEAGARLDGDDEDA